MGRKSASGSRIRDEQPGSYFLELRNQFFAFLGVKILKFFDEDPGSGMETVRIWDPGCKKVASWILDSLTALNRRGCTAKLITHGKDAKFCLPHHPKLSIIPEGALRNLGGRRMRGMKLIAIGEGER